MTSWLRGVWRMARFVGVLGCATIDGWRCRARPGFLEDPHQRANYLQYWARRFLKCFNLTVTCNGLPPRTGLIASNHTSYLDIVALADTMPCAFVSKSEVSRWPVIGMLTSVAGTLFLDRERKRAAHEVAESFAPVVGVGLPVCFFPEGTSTAGDRVLPFRAALFEPAVSRGWIVTPVAVRYLLADGQAAKQAAYWGDDVFIAHVWRLLKTEQILAEVCFGEPLEGFESRRELSTAAHGAVRGLLGLPGLEHAFDPVRKVGSADFGTHCE